jgi:hypothetical protein
MQLETKFLRLPRPPALGDHVDGWRVCWLGGWDRARAFYLGMVARVNPTMDLPQPSVNFFCLPSEGE